jgi:hypothetical protein
MAICRLALFAYMDGRAPTEDESFDSDIIACLHYAEDCDERGEKTFPHDTGVDVAGFIPWAKKVLHDRQEKAKERDHARR